ncbi:hypothetical protein K402DRAFT_6578 [Aulographum hederae CBS 113979]|uniref:Uncharacterized protein n=1 Tax=Aulographum hederae CBS 113979 TaxID=1176131 RepID=A0A6G1HHE4_9PEZI|nr:hypothetical protein K402DRAFT_6578 [Aulographum hederae CBS 113979]
MVVTDIVPVVNTGNNWIMFSILVATAVRLSSHPPVFELEFIRALLLLQLLMLAARTGSTFVLAHGKNDDVGIGRHKVWSTMFAFMAVIFTMSLGFKSYAATVQIRQAVMTMSHFCALEDGVPLPALYATDDGNATNVSKEKEEELQPEGMKARLIALGYFWLVVFSIPCVAYALYLLLKLCAKLPEAIQDALYRVGKGIVIAVGALLLLSPAMVWFSLCVWVLVILQDLRMRLQALLGTEYEDSYWGFGQVTAVVMLFPPLFQVLGIIFSKSHGLPLNLPWIATLTSVKRILDR